MSSNIKELAEKYRQALDTSNNEQEVTLQFVETYIGELSQFTLDQQEEFISLAQADPRWWISLNGQWKTPTRIA